MAIYIHDEAARLRLRVAGVLDAAASRELAACWRTAGSVVAGRKVAVDLTASAEPWDPHGLNVLAQLHASGAEFLVRTDSQKRLVAEVASEAIASQALEAASRRR